MKKQRITEQLHAKLANDNRYWIIEDQDGHYFVAKAEDFLTIARDAEENNEAFFAVSPCYKIEEARETAEFLNDNSEDRHSEES